MKPRSLRHRFEKTSKLLVIVQKHAPEVDCRLDEERGDHGLLIIDFEGSGMSHAKLVNLGKDLEGRGYQFKEKKSPWLGQTTYTGRATDKPSVILSIPIAKDRIGIDENLPESPYSFANA